MDENFFLGEVYVDFTGDGEVEEREDFSFENERNIEIASEILVLNK